LEINNILDFCNYFNHQSFHKDKVSPIFSLGGALVSVFLGSPEVNGRENVRVDFNFPVPCTEFSCKGGSMMDSRPAIEFWRLETDDEELKT
jgi:hypothetical protein